MVMSVHGAAEAGKPAWCAADNLHKADAWVDRALTSTDAHVAMLNLVGATCAKNGKQEAELAEARARWSKELDLTEADWATDVVPWAITDQGTRQNPTITVGWKDAPSTLDAIGQYGLMARSTSMDRDPWYALDMLGAKLTMTGRLAYIKHCLTASKPTEWALCQPDIDAFDRKQIGVEMHASKSQGGFERMAIRIAAHQLHVKLAKRAADTKALFAKDAAWAQVFAMSADAHKEWAASPPDAKLVALAAEMDDANITQSSKAFAGCEDRAWAGLASTVAALPAAKFKDLKEDQFLSGVVGVLVNDKNAYLAAVALVLCRSQSPDTLDDVLRGAMQRWPGFRGPRSFALTKLITGAISLDDRSARIEYPEVFRFKGFKGSSGGGGIGRGIVASVKPNGAKTHVEYVKKLTKQKVCTDWKDTNQIVQITSAGTVIYAYHCLKYGTETIDMASAPRDVDTRYADGLKPGTSARIVGNVVVSVAPKADSAPTWILGVAVK